MLLPRHVLATLATLRARKVTVQAFQLKRQERNSLNLNFANVEDMRALRAGALETGVVEVSEEVKSTTRRIGRLIKDGNFSEAWQLFETLDQRGTIEYCVGLHLCAQAGWIEEAQALWADMSQDVKSVVAYTTMIKMYANIKHVSKAERIFEEMKRNAVQPNLITYNTLINAYSMASMPEQAKSLFDSIPVEVFAAAGDSSRQTSFAGVMFAHARQGDYATTREIFMDMMSKGVKPNRNHFNAMITSCAKRGLAETARAIFDMLPQYGIQPACDTWTGLMSCHRHDLNHCKKIFDDMLSSGVQPSGLTYQVLLNAHVQNADGPGARKLLEDMEKFGLWQGSRAVEQLREEAMQLP